MGCCWHHHGCGYWDPAWGPAYRYGPSPRRRSREDELEELETRQADLEEELRAISAAIRRLSEERRGAA